MGAHWPQFHQRHLFGGLTASKDVADESSKHAAEPANAAGSNSGFSRLTHAAEFYASQAATQAAGLFSYKIGDEKSQEPHPPETRFCWGWNHHIFNGTKKWCFQDYWLCNL